MTRDEYVEQLAREIAKVRGVTLRTDMSDAEDVLTAIATIAERGGPKLVERKPTQKMVDEGMAVHVYHPKHIFPAMFDAAPAVPGGEE